MDVRFDLEQRDWLSPVVRFIEVPLIDFEEDGYSERLCNTITLFAKACNWTLRLVESNRPGHYGIALYVVRQFFVVVCKRFQAWVNRFNLATAQSEAVLREAIDGVQSILQDHWPARTLHVDAAPHLARMWMALTIFHTAIGAVASEYEPGGEVGFEDHVTDQEHGSAWLLSTRSLRPYASLLDYSDSLVGTTYAKWRDAECLKKWQKQIRTKAMEEPVKDLFQRARVATEPLRGRPWLHGEQREEWTWVLKEGKAAVQSALGERNAISRLCAGQKWVAVDRFFRHMDQCATCQIWFGAVRLTQANQAPEKVIGQIWDEACPWQCCEEEAYSMLWSKRRAEGEQRRLRALAYPLLEDREAAKAVDWPDTSAKLRKVPFFFERAAPPRRRLQVHHVHLTPTPALTSLIEAAPPRQQRLLLPPPVPAYVATDKGPHHRTRRPPHNPPRRATIWPRRSMATPTQSVSPRSWTWRSAALNGLHEQIEFGRVSWPLFSG